MTFIKRKPQNKLYKKSRYFYYAAIGFFVIFAFTNIGLCLYKGFTDERIALIMLNCWFIFYTMDLLTSHFKRKEEQVFWHDWIMFSGSSKDQEEIILEEEAPKEETQDSQNKKEAS